ncbi:unnamed protein product [Calypogeia fissa]
MTAFWPCDLLVSLRNRRKRRAPDVTCETLVGVEPMNSVTFKKKCWRRKKPGKLSGALTRLRDAYVNLMVNAAYRGDMSTLVYGTAYCGNEFRFDNSSSQFEKQAYISGIVKRSSIR